MAYVPGMPSVGIPTDVREKAEELYEKQQEERKQQEQQTPAVPTIPTIPTVQPQTPVVQPVQAPTFTPDTPTNYTVPGMPSSVPITYKTQAQISYNKQHVVSDIPKNIAVEILKKQQAQAEANRAFIENMTNSTLGMDATKVLSQTNTASVLTAAEDSLKAVVDSRYTASSFREFMNYKKYSAEDAYRALPTDALRGITNAVNEDKTHPHGISKPHYDRLKELNKLISAKDAEFQQHKLNEESQIRFWGEDEIQEVKCATAIDYYNMKNRGFQMVYVEDGCDTLKNKDNIYTIGRDKLAGIPKDVHSVIVDQDGNWYYIANTTSRAKLVETLQHNQAVSSAIYDKHIASLSNELTASQSRVEALQSKIVALINHAESTGDKSYYAKAQEAIEEATRLNEIVNTDKTKLFTLVDEWQTMYNRYETAIQGQTQWTVEDEARFQQVQASLENIRKYKKETLSDSNKSEYMKKVANAVNVNTPTKDRYSVDKEATLLSELASLSARRNKYKDSPAFLSVDTIEELRNNEAAMKKVIDEYNRWDAVTIHTENGEDMGTQIKRFILRDLIGDTDSVAPDLGSPTAELITSPEASSSYFLEDLKGIAKSYIKSTGYAAQIVAKHDTDKAQKAMEDVRQQVEEGKISKYEGALLHAQYMNSIKQTGERLKATLLNNTVANLSVLDITSFQKTYVAYKMAKDPERYSNDPKFKKLIDAYKYAYGEDFRGSMDAAKMAFMYIDMNAGKYGNDYVYVDAADLRHKEEEHEWYDAEGNKHITTTPGEHYGLLASMAVGLGTDVSFLASAAKSIVSTGTRIAGAKALTKTITESSVESLVRTGVTKEAAEELMKSTAIRKVINKESKAAIKRLVKSESDDVTTDILDDFIKTQRDKATLIAMHSNKEISDVVRAAGYTKFLDDITDTLARNVDEVKQTFAIQKGIVAVKTLGSLDDMLNNVQLSAFKLTCPAASAVVGIKKISNGIKYLDNLAAADTTHLKQLVETNQNATARIAEAEFVSVLDNKTLCKTFDNIKDEFSWGALSKLEHRVAFNKRGYDEALERFANIQQAVMRDTANAYTARVYGDLLEVFDKSGTKGLTDFAATHGYNSFDEMHAVVQENMEEVFKYSSDARSIATKFDNAYESAVTAQRVSEAKTVVENTNNHIKDIKAVFGSPDAYIISPFNALEHPDFVRGTAGSLKATIHTFTRTANPDFMKFVDGAGNLTSVHVSAQEAMEQLEKVALGDLSVNTIMDTQIAVTNYLEDVENVYMKHVTAWENNIIQDAYGVQNYMDNIKRILPQHGENDAVFNTVIQKTTERFERLGIHPSEDAIRACFISDPKELEKLSLSERNTVYRIIQSKVAYTVGQINDANLKIVTDQLIDCNSQLSKNLRLLLTDALDDINAQHISDAIANASAINATRIMSDTLKQSGMDSKLYMAILDVSSGNSGYINSIVRNNPPDIASQKLTDYFIKESSKRLALNNGVYKTFHNLGMDSVDVVSNVRNIAEQAAEKIPEDEQYLDVFFSTNRTADNAAPKDLAFYVRGDKGDPFVIRKDYHFAVCDNDFAKRVYGRTSEQLSQDYNALGAIDTVSSDTWKMQLNDKLTELKNRARTENKTIRFIGFNSSDSIGGGNKYLSDTLRASGANANTSTAIDFADVLRSDAGEYIFNPAHIDALNRGIRAAIDDAHMHSVTLDISPAIAYDSKYTCADMITAAFKDQNLSPELQEQAQYILNNMKVVSESLGASAYNNSGAVMGMYIDTQRLAKIMQDAGVCSDGVNKEINRIIVNASPNVEAQLGLCKTIETTIDSAWIDFSKMEFLPGCRFVSAEHTHDAVMQLNNITNRLRRVDLILESDRRGFETIYRELYLRLPNNSTAFQIARMAKVNDLSTVQLYALDKWLLDNARKTMSAQDFDSMFGGMLLSNNVQASKLHDVGYNFICNNVVDGTDDCVDIFKVTWLDDSEDGVTAANAMNGIKTLNTNHNGLKNYFRSIDGMFNKMNSHGAQDKMLLMQSAAVSKPIMDLQLEAIGVYNKAYANAVKELRTTAGSELENGFIIIDEDLITREATRRAWDSSKQFIQETGETLRSNSVLSAAGLDEDAFKAHLVRNCAGGIVIDPHSKCVQELDLSVMLKQWKDWGLDVDTIKLTQGNIKNRELIRVSMPDLVQMYSDDIYMKYNDVHIKFNNPTTRAYDKGMRHCSFNASDMTLVDADHVRNFRDTFFSDKPKGTILDLEGRFSDWRNEMYSCNMWCDADIKQLVNPYYTDNVLNNLAQNTHQMRNNISAAHDLASVINNPYMNSRNILIKSGVFDTRNPVAVQRDEIVRQIREQGQRLCKITLEKNGRFKLIDYTPRLAKASTSDNFFEDILKNTVMLDDGMFDVLSNWKKTTNMGLRMQATKVPEGLSGMYNLYKKTVRAGTVAMYLYGNIGTAVRNFTDSFLKGVFETFQGDEDIFSFLNNYKNATNDQLRYTNVYRNIETEFGVVDRSTIAEYFEKYASHAGDISFDDFNLMWGYENMVGADSLVLDKTINEQIMDAVNYFRKEDLPQAIRDNAWDIQRSWDKTYSSLKYRGYTNKRIAEHLSDIRSDCLYNLRKTLGDKLSKEDYELLGEMFYDYHPVSLTWGDKISQVFPLNFNKKQFNAAETRARWGLYKTFIQGGATEAEAIKHVTATQFNYAGIGKVEDFMPFTQYKLYNAMYWFDHADAHALTTMWRFAEYSGNGADSNKEISDMHAKYIQQQYYLYDKGADEDYDNFYENYLNPLGSMLLDGVDSYMGLPREFQTSSIDLEGTHFLKFGNSFIEEIDLVVSCAVGAMMFGNTVGNYVSSGETVIDKIRMGYEALKYTPLYDSLYSPWKSYIDLAVYAYDHKRLDEYKKELYTGVPSDVIDKTFNSKTIWDYYKDFVKDKSTHSEAIQGLPVVGAVLTNMVGRWKSFDLNLGQLMGLIVDPDAKTEFKEYTGHIMSTVLGMTIPSIFGTVKPEKTPYNYGATLSKLRSDPTTYFSIIGRLQRDMGFTEDQAHNIMGEMVKEWKQGGRLSQEQYYEIARNLYAQGFTEDEITNLFKQHNLPDIPNSNPFLAFTEGLPNYIKYDKDMRVQILDHYKAMGMSSREAWAYLMAHPSYIKDGRVIELTEKEVDMLNKLQTIVYNATKGYVNFDNMTQEEIDAYWKEYNEAYAALLKQNNVYYPKGKLKETTDYLRAAGYTFEEARKLLLKGFMLDDNGKLVDTQGRTRYQKFSNSLKGAAWDAYWETVPNYTKYEKGAYKRIMSYLKGQGYNDDQARTLIQQGFYIDDFGNMMNVTGMERPRYNTPQTFAGFSSFNEYYQSLPDYIRFEKGAFKQSLAFLRNVGFDYDTSLRIIQMGFVVPTDGMVEDWLKDLLGTKSYDSQKYEFSKEVLGYADFNTFYQTLPDYIKYEKGAFVRTRNALMELGYDYETSLRFIQQGAYLMDASTIPALATALTAQTMQFDRSNIKVTDVNTLLQKHGMSLITGADGKQYLLVNCSGLQRPRKTYNYSRKTFNKKGRGSYEQGGFWQQRKSYQRRSWTPRSFGRRRGGKYPAGSRNYGGHHYSKKTYPYKFKPSTFLAYTTRKPYISQGNVSSFNGFKSMRGSTKLSKPYTTQGYVSTYSAQNFLNGASYGIRKTYKIDMRQFKTGALSTKSAYPASYRNIAVAYRRNMYKDLYAKYGMSRMRMRANKQGYSNAAITRLRRNEIYNRERYAERRDRKAKEKKPTR